MTEQDPTMRTEADAVRRGCHHCGVVVESTHLYCRAHWHALPLSMRNAVFTSFRAWKKARNTDTRREYIIAVRVCRTYLNAAQENAR